MKRNTMVRYVGNPRGVLSVHVSSKGSFRCLSEDVNSRVRRVLYVQTGDILTTERNAARVLFGEGEGQ